MAVLPLETTAELMAYLAHFGGDHLDEILQRRGVDAPVWEESSDHWKARIVESSADPEAPELSTFNGSFAETRKRIEDEQLELEDLGPLPKAEEAPPEAAAAPEENAQVAPPAPVEAPPPVVAPAPVAAPMVPAAAEGSSPWVHPTQAPRVEAMPAAVPPAAARVEPSEADITAPPVAMSQEPIPFQDAITRSAPPAAAPEVAQEAEALAGGTAFVAPVTDDVLQRSTPFPKRERAEPVEDLAASVDGTAFISAPLLDEPLPFDGDDQATPPAMVGELEQSGETGFMQPASVGGREVRLMSPEHYARLVHSTHDKSAVERQRRHANYGLHSEADRTELDQTMTAYFQENPAMLRVYMQWLSYLRRTGQ